MKFIGLLMVADEDDILERTLEHNTELVDCFYALDGSTSHEHSGRTCISNPKCAGYATDDNVRATGNPRDGWRQHILEMAYSDHGRDNWFVLLHGDELWTTDPRDHADPDHDGCVFNLPFYFPREGEPWNDDEHPIDQLAWRLGPGWPELRMFRGGPNVNYDPVQHFNVTPHGLTSIVDTGAEILHYPYRSPNVQRARAARHEQTGFDPDNYRHILDGDNVYWTDGMIADAQTRPQFRDLHINEVGVR